MWWPGTATHGTASDYACSSPEFSPIHGAPCSSLDELRCRGTRERRNFWLSRPGINAAMNDRDHVGRDASVTPVGPRFAGAQSMPAGDLLPNGLRRPRGNANACFIGQELRQCRREAVPASPGAIFPRIRRADPDPGLGSERRSRPIPEEAPSIGSTAQDCPERQPTASSWSAEHRPRWRYGYDSTHRFEQSRPAFCIRVRSR